ncbi:glycoside hydrolase superfamily [Chytriomyces sp. MP71]|nr:glycoside hydrolase superfamily [Chytriomyces sp. MP71]
MQELKNAQYVAPQVRVTRRNLDFDQQTRLRAATGSSGHTSTDQSSTTTASTGFESMSGSLLRRVNVITHAVHKSHQCIQLRGTNYINVYPLKMRVCFVIFWLKVFLALSMTISMLAYFCLEIYQLHLNATPPNGFLPDRPIQIVDPATGKVDTGCNFDASQGFARLQPQSKRQIMLGMSLDWHVETPLTMRRKLNGFNPLVYNTFMLFDADMTGYYDRNSLNWFGSEVGKVGGILELTMQPSTPDLSRYNDSMFDVLAQQLYTINSQYGVPILLRFGHEMNGDWVVYGNRPLEFVALFRQMAGFVRMYTNMTAMVWGPNVGTTYPYVGVGLSPIPTTGPEFEALDTNHDGVIDQLDDPYTPYYPGDDVVDWVALSLYYYPFDDCRNCPVPTTYFHDYLTGSGPVVAKAVDPDKYSSQYTSVHSFYNMFCTSGSHNKPILLPETGSPYVPEYGSGPGQWNEVDIKMAWWNQIFNQSTLDQFPNLLVAVNFEEAKEKTTTNLTNDWRLTKNSVVLNTFLGLLSSFRSNLKEAGDFVYGCDGSVKGK